MAVIEWWQWLIGGAEFVAAWWATDMVGRAYRDRTRTTSPVNPGNVRLQRSHHAHWQQPTDRAVHPNDWPTKQCVDCLRYVKAAIPVHGGWRCRECMDATIARKADIYEGLRTGVYTSTPQHIVDDLHEKLRNTKPPPDRSGIEFGTRFDGWGHHLLSVAVGLTAIAAGIAGLRGR
jgi:hypothetical protein